MSPSSRSSSPPRRISSTPKEQHPHHLFQQHHGSPKLPYLHTTSASTSMRGSPFSFSSSPSSSPSPSNSPRSTRSNSFTSFNPFLSSSSSSDASFPVANFTSLNKNTNKMTTMMSTTTPITPPPASLQADTASPNGSDSDISSPSTAGNRRTFKRQRHQRRLLNKLAVYLPRNLKPIAASPARFLGTSTVFIVTTLLLFLSHSTSSSSTEQNSLLQRSSGFFFSKAAIIPAIVNGHNEAIIGDFGFNGKRGDNNNANDGKHYSEKTNANAMQKQPPQHLIEAHGHDSGARVAPAHVQKRDDQINLPSSTEQIGAEQQNNGDQSFISSDHNAEHIQVGDSTSCVNNGYEFEGYMHSGDAFVNRHPTANFRDNLRKDVKYLTFGMMNGFTAQFLALANGIYLAKLSDRVPVLPPFATSQHKDRKEAGYLPFSRVFDIPYLESMLRHPVQDWSNLKIAAEQTPALSASADTDVMMDSSVEAKAKVKQPSIAWEKISCWSLWASQMPEPGKPAGSAVQNHLGLHVEFWKVPNSFSHPPQDRHIRYWDLVMLDQNIKNSKTDHLHSLATDMRKDPSTKLPPPPDDQMICYDTLYYTAATGPQEWWQPHAPVWKAIGRHAHFTKEVSDLADKYVRFLLQIDKKVRMPEFISVHIRRGDFSRHCGSVPVADCFAPLEAYKRAVNRVREAILEAKGVYVRWVVVTTDERDPAFLASIDQIGWAVVNHEALKTREVHGLWWETVLDAAIQSKGSGFVGTDKSSMSLIAGRRVVDWNKGPSELVKWGRKGAGL